jgi:hypothetical protein
MDETRELGDHVFAEATEAIAQLSSAIEEDLGRKPTVAELAEVLYRGIRSCSPEPLSDVGRGEIVKVRIEVKRRMKSRKKTAPPLRRGDVLSVPRGKERDPWLLVYLGKFGTFGQAFGILGESLHPLTGQAGRRWGRHIFAGLRGYESGRWKLQDHKAELLGLFQPQPEYYYPKRLHPDDEGIGPWGAAETEDAYEGRRDLPGVKDLSSRGETSVVRWLDEAEARELGLLDPSFFQVGVEDAVEGYLARLDSVPLGPRRVPGDGDQGGSLGHGARPKKGKKP